VWENNIKMYLREIEWGDVYWIYMAQDRDRWLAVVNAVMNVCVRETAGDFLAS
jgi:hypothetical protein